MTEYSMLKKMCERIYGKQGIRACEHRTWPEHLKGQGYIDIRKELITFVFNENGTLEYVANERDDW